MEEFGFATCFKQSKCRAIHSNIVVKCRHRAAPTALATDAAAAAVCVPTNGFRWFCYTRYTQNVNKV